jgi:hypothetical protein
VEPGRPYGSLLDIGRDGVLFVATYSRVLAAAAVDIAAGREIWRLRQDVVPRGGGVGGSQPSSRRDTRGVVITANRLTYRVALNLESRDRRTGRLLWRSRSSGAVVGDTGGFLLLLAPGEFNGRASWRASAFSHAGTKAWQIQRFESGGQVSVFPGILVIRSWVNNSKRGNATLRRIDVGSGRVVWKREIAAAADVDAVSASAGVVVVRSRDTGPCDAL